LHSEHKSPALFELNRPVDGRFGEFDLFQQTSKTNFAIEARLAYKFRACAELP
jgi:hypothetical protein